MTKVFGTNHLLSSIENDSLRLLHSQDFNGAASSILTFQNAQKTIEKHQPYQIYFVLYQDQRSNVTYFPYQKDTFEISAIQKLLDYQTLDIDTRRLLFSESPKKETYFDKIQFKSGGWRFTVIYLESKNASSLRPNLRLQSLLSLAGIKRPIFGNAFVYGYCTERGILRGGISETYTTLSNQLKDGVNLVVRELLEGERTNNHRCLAELMHRHGLNVGMEWLMVIQLDSNPRAKLLVMSDLLVRAIKAWFRKRYRFSSRSQSTSQQKMEELLGNDSMSFKQEVARLMNLFFSLSGTEVEESEESQIFNEVYGLLNLKRMLYFDYAQTVLTPLQHQRLIKDQIIQDIVKMGAQESGVLLDAFLHHFKISVNAEMERRIRNDKYYFMFHQKRKNFMHSDINNVVLDCEGVLSVRERAYVQLIRNLRSRKQK